MTAPVIAIDGPSASGKGTVAALVAARLGFHYLDSGSLYRLLAFFAQRNNIGWNDEPELAALAAQPVDLSDGPLWLGCDAASAAIRSEEISVGASKVGALPAVRAALLQRQRDFCQFPGLVTDGRDMGSVVFPTAILKVFLTASAEERAKRRCKQLIEEGDSASLQRILREIIDRDARDAARRAAPLRKAPDALLLDTTDLTIDQAVIQVLCWFERRQIPAP